MGDIRLPRGTLASLNARAVAGTLSAGGSYFITDISRIAIGTSTTTYVILPPAVATAYANLITGAYLKNGAVVTRSDLITVTRSGDAYGLDSTGVWKKFTGVGRFTDLGLYLEGARTNLMQQSARIFNPTWSLEAGSAKTLLTGGPIEGSDSCTIAWTSGNGRISQNKTVASGTTYRVIIIVKAGTSAARYAVFRDGFANSGTNANYVWDLLNGTTGYMGAGASNASIRSIGNGYYQLEVDILANTTGAATSFFHVNNNAVTSDTFVAPSSGMTSFDVAYCDLISGAGSSSPIVSGSSTLTRSADTGTLILPTGTLDMTITYGLGKAAVDTPAQSGSISIPMPTDKILIEQIQALAA